jgi:hypothetical protein
MQVNAEHSLLLKDTARSYHWDIDINLQHLPQQFIEGRCSTVSQPQPDYNVIELNVRGFTKVESGAPTWNELTVTMFESEDLELLKALWTLGEDQCNSETLEQKPKSDYSIGNNSIVLYGIDGSTTSGTWILHHPLVANFQPGDLNNEKSGIVETPFTIRYDRAEFTGG